MLLKFRYSWEHCMIGTLNCKQKRPKLNKLRQNKNVLTHVAKLQKGQNPCVFRDGWAGSSGGGRGANAAQTLSECCWTLCQAECQLSSFLLPDFSYKTRTKSPIITELSATFKLHLEKTLLSTVQKTLRKNSFWLSWVFCFSSHHYGYRRQFIQKLSVTILRMVNGMECWHRKGREWLLPGKGWNVGHLNHLFPA